MKLHLLQLPLKFNKFCNYVHPKWKDIINGWMLNIPFLCRATSGSSLAAHQLSPEAQEVLRSPYRQIEHN